MATTQDYINQLKIDKQNLVTMLNNMGVEASENETFTALTPKVGKIVTDPILQDKTIEITENGTQTITADEGYNGLNNVSVTTNVSGGDASALDEFVTRGLTSYSSDKIRYVGKYAFYNCTKLVNVDLPLVESLEASCFAYCTALETVKFPNLTTTNTSALANCTSLKKADLGLAGSLANNLFLNSTNLETLILRKKNKICSCGYSSAIGTTKIASGTGYIYVPSSLVANYKTSNDYKNYANQIRAIEDYPEICS